MYTKDNNKYAKFYDKDELSNCTIYGEANNLCW